MCGRGRRRRPGRPRCRARRRGPAPPAGSRGRSATAGTPRGPGRAAARRPPTPPPPMTNVRVQRGGEVGDADPSQLADLLEQLDRRPGRRPARPAVTSGPVMRATSPSAASSRRCATGEPDGGQLAGLADQRVAARRTAPSSPGCRTRSGGPSGTTCMWPNSARHRRTGRAAASPSMTIAPPMPVPRLTQTTCASPRPAPKRHSAQAAALASFSTTTGSRAGARSPSRSGSLPPGQVRREQHGATASRR